MIGLSANLLASKERAPSLLFVSSWELITIEAEPSSMELVVTNSVR